MCSEKCCFVRFVVGTKLVYVVVRERERGVYCNELFSLRKAKVLGKRSCHFFTHKSALNVSKKKTKKKKKRKYCTEWRDERIHIRSAR